MATQHASSLEAQEQVLAVSLHRFEAASVQPLGDTGRTSPRMHGLDGQPLPDKGSQPPSHAVNGVAFRHRSGPEA